MKEELLFSLLLLYLLKFSELLHEWDFVQSETVNPRAQALVPQCYIASAEPWPVSRSFTLDSNPSSKVEVYCGKCLSRIFVVSATSMPPSSWLDEASYFDGWVIQSFFIIYSGISSLRGGFFMFSIRPILCSPSNVLFAFPRAWIISLYQYLLFLRL